MVMSCCKVSGDSREKHKVASVNTGVGVTPAVNDSTSWSSFIHRAVSPLLLLSVTLNLYFLYPTAFEKVYHPPKH